LIARRLDARAVERFIKFIQAMTRMNAAIMENNLTYSILPPDCRPFSKVPCRYVSEKGIASRVLGRLFSCLLEIKLAVFSLN